MLVLQGWAIKSIYSCSDGLQIVIFSKGVRVRESLYRALYTRDRLIRLSPIKLLFTFVPTKGVYYCIYAEYLLNFYFWVGIISTQKRRNSSLYPESWHLNRADFFSLCTLVQHPIYFSIFSLWKFIPISTSLRKEVAHKGEMDISLSATRCS